MNLSGGLSEVLSNAKSDKARWFAIMGNPPVRAVFETALGLPDSLARLDLDQQLDAFKSRAQATFGTDKVGELATPEQEEKMIRLFLIRSQANAVAATSAGSVALTLLQNAPRLF